MLFKKSVFFLFLCLSLCRCASHPVNEEDSTRLPNGPLFQLTDPQIIKPVTTDPPPISIRAKPSDDRSKILLTFNEPWLIKHYGGQTSSKEFTLQFKAAVKAGLQYAIAPLRLAFVTKDLKEGSKVRLLISTSLNGWNPNATFQHYFEILDDNNKDKQLFTADLASQDLDWSKCVMDDSSLGIAIKFRVESLASEDTKNALATEIFWPKNTQPFVSLKARSCR